MHRIGILFGNEVFREVTESNYSNLLLILKGARWKFCNKLII
jgi:hypothetical protein